MVYVCLFTCASIRTISQSCNWSYRNDISKGFLKVCCPQVATRLVISDNESTWYTSAAKELNELFQSPTLRSALMHKGTIWRFIPNKAPWYGGFWERLVEMVKMSLKKILGRALITLPVLQTTIVEVEAVLNDRQSANQLRTKVDRQGHLLQHFQSWW